MKTRKSLLFVMPLIMMVLLACQATNVNFTSNRKVIQGSGNAITEDRQVQGIERVSLRFFGTLDITQGDTESLTIEADDNIMPHIKSEMRGGELILEIEEGYTLNSHTDVHYTLKVKDLDRISVSGVGKINMDSLKTDKFSMDISGAGDATFGSLEAQSADLELSGTGKVKLSNVKLETVKITSSGAGSFEMTGEVTRQDVTISGAGSYEGGDLKSDETRVQVSGAGSITVWAESKLSINISGFGSVNYYGQPEVSKTISGGGSIKGLGTH